MNVKKKANKFGKQLVDLLTAQGKLPAEVITYVMATEMIHMMVGDEHPSIGLNELFNIMRVAAMDQGYRIEFHAPTLH